MICPECGFDPVRGDRCQQCGAQVMDKESGGGRSSAGPSPPQTPPAKHRSHPLHDLDLTISMPGLDAEKPAAAPSQKESPPKNQPAPGRPVQAPKEPPSKVHTSTDKPAAALPCTTTQGIEGRRIASYLGLVSGAAVIRGKAAEEFSSTAAETAETRQARDSALENLKREAAKLGSDAVIGITASVSFGPNGMLTVLTGTAVRLQKA